MKTLILVLLLGCPDAPGICSAQYFACTDSVDCATTKALLYRKYRSEERFTRIDMAYHTDWPPDRLAWGMPTPRPEINMRKFNHVK